VTYLRQSIVDFPSVASMVAATTHVDGDLVKTLGYYAAGDGGGNSYIYHATGRPTADGGFFIDGPVADDYFEAVDKTVAKARQFGAVGDGTTNDSESIRNVMQVGHDKGVPVLIDGGTSTTYLIASTNNVELTNDLQISSDGAKLRFSAIFGLVGLSRGVAMTLTSDADWKANVISLNDASILEVGDTIQLTTTTQVCTTYTTYYKKATSVVADINGNDVTLSHPLPFHFTVAETSVGAAHNAGIQLKGLDIFCSSGGRLDFQRLQNSVINNAKISSAGITVADPVLMTHCVFTTFNNTEITKARYGVNLSTACRDTYFNTVKGWGCRHPIDANSWAYGTYVNDFLFYNTEGSVQCHPAFEVHFNNGTFDGGYGCRAIGASLKNAISNESQPIAETGSQTIVSLLPEYEYLLPDKCHYIHNVNAPNVHFQFSPGRYAELKNVQMLYFSNDAVGGSGTDILYVDRNCSIADLPRGRRYKKFQDNEALYCKSNRIFSDPGTPLTITNITQANPAVVTSAGHGLTTGDSVEIVNVLGMVEINDQHSRVTVVDANSFQLDWIDSTGYTSYTSGGTATPGTVVQYCDPTSIENNSLVGHYPACWYITNLISGTSAGSNTTDYPKKMRVRLHQFPGDDSGATSYGYGEITVTVCGRFDSLASTRFRFGQREGIGGLYATPEVIMKTSNEEVQITNIEDYEISSGLSALAAVQFDWNLTNWPSADWVNLATVEVKYYPRTLMARR
jgi:hypothetical protein